MKSSQPPIPFDQQGLVALFYLCPPLRSRRIAALNRFMGRTVMRAAATRNFPGERVGFLTRAFEYVYQRVR